MADSRLVSSSIVLAHCIACCAVVVAIDPRRHCTAPVELHPKLAAIDLFALLSFSLLGGCVMSAPHRREMSRGTLLVCSIFVVLARRRARMLTNKTPAATAIMRQAAGRFVEQNRSLIIAWIDAPVAKSAALLLLSVAPPPPRKSDVVLDGAGAAPEPSNASAVP